MRRSLQLLLLLSGLCAAAARGQEPALPQGTPAATPWGVSSSASSFRDIEEWFPQMAAAGVTSVRMFPEWRGFQPARGEWNWEAGDRLVRAAAANGLELTPLLMGSPPGTAAGHAFPMEDLDGWSAWVTGVVARYRGSVRHWEVWNEGNGGFNDGKHTTADYAKLAAATIAAARRADPKAKVGLTVASFDPAYLREALRALVAANSPLPDFLCVHPYELADGLARPNGEIPFLWMSKLLTDAVREATPQGAEPELWITEVGRRIERRDGREVTDEEAARALVKIYTLAIAQGFARVQWFEGRDPAGEDQGFGLVARDGRPRPALHSLRALFVDTNLYEVK